MFDVLLKYCKYYNLYIYIYISNCMKMVMEHQLSTYCDDENMIKCPVYINYNKIIIILL